MYRAFWKNFFFAVFLEAALKSAYPLSGEYTERVLIPEDFLGFFRSQKRLSGKLTPSIEIGLTSSGFDIVPSLPEPNDDIFAEEDITIKKWTHEQSIIVRWGYGEKTDTLAVSQIKLATPPNNPVAGDV